MDNEEIEETPRGNTKWIIVLAVVFVVIVFFAVAYDTDKAKKNTLDERMKLIEDMRAEKKIYEQKITDLNQRIVKQKCDVFSEVKAKTQWEQDCQEVFEQQKSVTE